MPERLERLQSTLHELEAELASLDSLDEETRERLGKLKDEISEVLGKTGTDDEPRHESLVERLTDAAEDFETSHPTLFGIVRRTIDALGQMGI